MQWVCKKVGGRLAYAFEFWLALQASDEEQHQARRGPKFLNLCPAYWFTVVSNVGFLRGSTPASAMVFFQ
jgi:hypothetical protein